MHLAYKENTYFVAAAKDEFPALKKAGFKFSRQTKLWSTKNTYSAWQIYVEYCDSPEKVTEVAKERLLEFKSNRQKSSATTSSTTILCKPGLALPSLIN